MTEITKAYEAAPGTEILIDENQSHNIHRFQHAEHGDGHILLVPQPSLTDLNDPLCWPQWKKWMVYINGLGYSFLGSIIGPIMSGGMVQQAAFFNIPISHLAWSAGICIIASGVATAFMMPLSVKIGRRPIFLLSTLAMGLGCVWCGIASRTTFASFFVGRAFVGLLSGPVEALIPSTITDIFFLHDRGEKISIYGLSVLGGNELGPILAFFILSFGIFVNFITIFFFMPETVYYGSRPVISLTSEAEVSSEKKGDESIDADTKVTNADAALDAKSEIGTTEVQIPQKSYLDSIKLWSKDAINPHVSYRKAFLRPFVLCTYPTVMWASLVYGMSLTWNVVLALTIAQLFAPPPYSFDSGAQGLIFLAPFVGSLIGTYLCGRLADQIALYYTRKNNGIREPEMRLPIALLATILNFVGVAIAGPCYHYKTHWIGPIIGFGVLSIGAQMGCNLSMTYALDCHKELSGELMITVSVIKSLIAWAWSWFINDWIALNGMMTVYFIIAGINVIVYGSTLIFYLKGKEFRIGIQKRDLFGRTGLA
ncbi:major facilitator superfamily domain-containing protein [Plectosphaerella plurivora]|uniref:Major facilitator superfamily domain-containing protein n=1 Tax=Plectosphaerella plurivora TaxID=936078 RepID=A0A9P8VJ97_9PEZI|nr:major facilitator superfamily domain-containing protein [Plectosphaerella plurivora]